MIPKNLHFIWVGPHAMPETFLAEWRRTYVDYTIKIWNDATVMSSEVIPKALQDEYYNNSFSPAFKADILRYCVINKFGGLYFDMDFECLKRLSDIFLQFSFLGGIQNNGEVAIGFLGGESNTELLTEVIENIPASIQRSKENSFYNNLNIHKITGPEFFNTISRKYMNRENYFFFADDYFYPYWFEEPARKNEKFKQTSPLAYGVHHWEQSWKRKKY